MKGGKQFTFTAAMMIVLLMFPMNYANSAPLDTDGEHIHSEAYIVMDATTGEKLYGKNVNEQMYPASITKIVTALIALETQEMDSTVQVSEKAVHANGTRVYLLEDEEISVEQLLHGLMVSSGNDAGIALAEHISGSVDAFAEKMNEFVKEKIGAENTNFTNPHGLFEEDHVTTAKDMADISAYAMQNEAFRDLVGTESYDWVGEGWETTLFNHHPLLRQYEEVTGIKNGYVQKSGFTLVTSAVEGDTEFIIVTLNSPSSEHGKKDTLALMEKAMDTYETRWLTFEDSPDATDYDMPSEMAVTVFKNENVTYSVTDNGFLNIRGTGDRLVGLKKLETREPLDLPNFTYEIVDGSLPAEKDNDLLFDWLVVTGFLYFSLK